jgi:hypothetical protein
MTWWGECSTHRKLIANISGKPVARYHLGVEEVDGRIMSFSDIIIE